MQGKRNDSLIKQRENTYTPKSASCVTIKERECIRSENYTLSWRNTLRLLTLTEYCLLIFFTGFYLAVTGFTAKDIGLYIGIALIYIFSHIFSKRLLEKRGKREQTGSPFLQCASYYRFSVHHGFMHCIGRFFFKIKTPAVLGQQGVFILFDAFR